MPTPSEQIDEHIAGLKDWRGDVMRQLRVLINQADPTIKEDWKWDIPIFASNGNVCAIGAFKEHVKLNFFKGASITDRKHLFNAGLDAKASRAIDFKQGTKIDQDGVTELVRAAVALNARKK